MQVTSDAAEILRSPSIDAVAIVTPVWTHFELAMAALENGKHVFLEKPLTSNAIQAERADRVGTRRETSRLWWTTRFCLPAAVKKIRQLIDQGELGDLYYYDSTRVNWAFSNTTLT